MVQIWKVPGVVNKYSKNLCVHIVKIKLLLRQKVVPLLDSLLKKLYQFNTHTFLNCLRYQRLSEIFNNMGSASFKGKP